MYITPDTEKNLLKNKRCILMPGVCTNNKTKCIIYNKWRIYYDKRGMARTVSWGKKEMGT